MSLLERMSIQGIRSFSPESSQKIEFFTPVTLILGPNGTGKTTIIECLKYASTGELPPGSKTGGSFVHDPKLAQEVEVKAKVTLQIKDIRGNEMVISRALVASQKEKAKQVSMRTLDGSIKRRLPDGQTTSLSSKCAELDREMVSSLGVSKAVLENVIFCHQEEANWPLTEGKMVKQRFDDLFASSRYVKALEVIRKTKQEQDNQVKLFKTELKYLTEQKEEARKMRTEKEKVEVQLRAKDDSLKKITEKLEPVGEKLTKYRKKYSQILEIQAKMETAKKEQDHLDSRMIELRSHIKEEFTGSDEELQTRVNDSDIRLEEMKISVEKAERKLASDKKEMMKLELERNRLLVEKGKLESEDQNYEKTLSSRKAMMKKYAEEFGIRVPVGALARSDVSSFIRKVEDRQTDAEKDVQDVMSACKKEENEAQLRLDRVRGELAQLEHSIQTKSKTMEKNEASLREIQANLEEVSSTAHRLGVLKEELRKVESDLARSSSTCNVTELKEQVEVAQMERRDLEKRINSLDGQIDQLHKESSVRKELDMHTKEMLSKEEVIRKIRSRHLDVLEQLFTGEVPEKHLRHQFDERLRSIEQSNRESRNKIKKLETEIASLETSCMFDRDQLKEKEDIVRANEDRMFSLCGSSDFQQSLDKIQTRKKQLEDERASIQGTLYTFRKFKERLERSNADCPLCHRRFDRQSEVRELVQELESKLMLAPEELDKKDKELVEVNRTFETMIQMQPVCEEIETLKSSVIPALQQKQFEKMEKIKKWKADVDMSISLLDVGESDASLAKNIQGDLAVLERAETELEDKRVEVNQYQRLVGERQTKMSLEDVQQEKSTCQARMEKLRKETEEKRSRMEEQTENLQRLKSEENRLKEATLKIERGMAERGRLTAEVERLDQEQTLLQVDMCEEKERKVPLTKEITRLEVERAACARRREAKTEESRGKVNYIAKVLESINSVQTDVDSFETARTRDKLFEVKQHLESISEQKEALDRVTNCLTEEIEGANSKIANHKILQRDLEDCQQLRKAEARVGELMRTMQAIGVQLEGLDVTNIERDCRQLASEEEKLREQKQVFKDEKNRLVTLLSVRERDLREKYKDAEKRYTEKIYELRTTELASVDLGNYYKALDRAIMSYHAQKMEEINKIIKELWRNTYRGNDIDYIEIRSDEDEMAGACKARRTYNYRVAMVKSSTWLDMRGRCSAGQKVLASLIIRLALAEVFCLHCGVLALDEPTTNLDRENIESLAYALVEIIKSRSRQKNFQLVIITHDEDFVELLGRSEYVEDFFRISRNSRGLSEIKRLRVDQQFR